MSKNTNSEKKYRFLNQDGTSNLIKPKTHTIFQDMYHSILGMSWPRFFIILTALYFSVNFIFALIYFMLGPSGLSGIKSDIPYSLNFFAECFFFSIQTFSTIGYGSVSPSGLLDNVVVSFQALLGLLSVGLMSGLFFSRFSKPTSRVAHSKVALMTNYDGQRVFMFRMANARLNQIIEANVSVMVAIDTTSQEGQTLRKLTDLNLVRSKTPAFALSWTVIHIIDEKSPLYQKTLPQLEEINAEFFILVSGHDESFNQLVFSRYSYTPNDIQLDRQFKDILIRNGHNLRIEIENISELKS
jgi:inward rectifier potassium channel